MIPWEMPIAPSAVPNAAELKGRRSHQIMLWMACWGGRNANAKPCTAWSIPVREPDAMRSPDYGAFLTHML